jgi:ribosomal protein S27E
MDRHFETFQRVYEELFQAKYGFWRPVIDRSVTAFLRCGDLREGFARVRCPGCDHEMFVAFSCKQRCTCPSCHQKRTLLTAIHVAEEVCFPVAHRQVVLTIPKRLRLHTRFDRKLLGSLCSCAWKCIQVEVRRLLGRDDVLPGMIAAIQTHGELLHWHPHIHTLVTCGAFTPEGEFLEVPEFDVERLQAAWRDAVFALYLAEGKIEPEVVENMRGWPHSGFSVDQSVYLPAGDRAGIERLVQYMTRCPFSLSRLVKVSKTGQVVYKAEKDACRAFPGWKKGTGSIGAQHPSGRSGQWCLSPFSDELASGPKRNFQILDPLDFLAEFTQHIPPKGAHLIRYYGWYSNKARGMRRKAASGVCPDFCVSKNGTVPLAAAPVPTASRCSLTWAMLIKRVYEVDPLACPKCGGQMRVIAFIEPPQGAVIEKILRHCGLWQPSAPRAPPVTDDWVHDPDGDSDGRTSSAAGPREQVYVDIDRFEATF